MGLQLQIEEKPDYLASRFTGAGAAWEIGQHFESIAEYCKRANKNKLLFDLTKADIVWSLPDMYFTAEKSRIFTRYGLQVAVVNIQERLDPKRFGEMVAQNRWLNVRVFTNTEDAEEWLLK